MKFCQGRKNIADVEDIFSTQEFWQGSAPFGSYLGQEVNLPELFIHAKKQP
jgi:hypothetical protein